MQTKLSLTTVLAVGTVTAALGWRGVVRGDGRASTAAQAPPGYVASPVNPGSVVAGVTLTCPLGALVEPEPCQLGVDTSLNGGCNNLPERFTDVPPNTTVCGTASTFLSDGGANFRDTDWYRFTLPTAASVEWCATAEFPARLFILRGTCPASSLGTISALPLVRTCISLDLPAGTYNAFVGTDAFSGVPCGGTNAYVATLRSGSPARVTYQGQLKRDGSPISGAMDMQFRLFDAAADGTQFGSTNTLTNVPVANGLFTVELGFGLSAFDGGPSFLEISVDDPTIPLTTLVPRQPITFAPQAAHATFAGHSLSASTAAFAGSASTVDWSGVANVPPEVTDFNSLNASDGSPADALFVNAVGNVGIGTTLPVRRLHVFNGDSGGVTHSSAELAVEDNTSCYINVMAPDASERGVSFGSPADAVHGGVYYTNAGGLNLRTNGNLVRMTINANGDVGVGVTGTIDARLHVQETGRVAKFDRFGSDGEIVAFARDDGVIGTISNAGGIVSYNAFTGSHYAWSAANLAAGSLVSLTGENRRFGDRSDSEVVYGIQETARPNDPACLGAYLALQEPSQASGDDNPHLVMAVGNGEMWVVDRGPGDLQPGDALISSDVSGCAMKDDPARFPVGHVVARAAEAVRWAQVTETTSDGVKRKKVSVLLDSFVRGSEDERLVEQVRAQQNEIDELKRRMAQMEAAFPRSTQ